MGLFLQLGGVLAPESEVSTAVEALKSEHSKALTKVGYYAEVDDRVLVFFDDYAEGAEQVVASLSKRLGCPAFWFHIHDGDLWMYLLFNAGAEVDRFNTSPGYWQEVDDSERLTWAGNAKNIVEVWSGVDLTDIERYLVDHEADGFAPEEKAYQSDEFPAWDCWQMVDFTAKLGLPYPSNGEE